MQSNPTSWIIYSLANPRTREIRYIGFTSDAPHIRLRHHICEALRTQPKTYKNAWILSLLTIGLRPLMETIESGSGAGWQEAERKWIAFYRSSGARLANATDGGDGVVGWGTPEQWSARIRKGNANMTPEERSATAKRSQATIGPDRRSAIKKKMMAAIGHERLSANSKAAFAKVSPERKRELKEIKKQAATRRSPEAINASAQVLRNLTFEQRSARAQKAAVTRKANHPKKEPPIKAIRTWEQRSEARKKWEDAMTPEQKEQRRERARQMWVRRSPEVRSAIGKKVRAGMTPEARLASACHASKCAYEALLAKKRAKASDQLPIAFE